MGMEEKDVLLTQASGSTDISLPKTHEELPEYTSDVEEEEVFPDQDEKDGNEYDAHKDREEIVSSSDDMNTPQTAVILDDDGKEENEENVDPQTQYDNQDGDVGIHDTYEDENGNEIEDDQYEW